MRMPVKGRMDTKRSWRKACDRVPRMPTAGRRQARHQELGFPIASFPRVLGLPFFKDQTPNNLGSTPHLCSLVPPLPQDLAQHCPNQLFQAFLTFHPCLTL